MISILYSYMHIFINSSGYTFKKDVTAFNNDYIFNSLCVFFIHGQKWKLIKVLKVLNAEYM